MNEFIPHDVIYLQISDSDEPIRIDETTWCSDKINDGDVKYLLATPEREAAPEMYEAVRKAEQLATIATDWNLTEAEIDGEMVSVYELRQWFQSTLALADGEVNGTPTDN